MQRVTQKGLPRTTDVGQVVSEKRSKGYLNVSELVLISVGGIIGAGFFLGVGLPIRNSGPSIVLAFFLASLVSAQVIGALATLSIDDPQPGSFMVYASKYLGTYTGFLQGWGYYISSILAISSEAVAMSIFTQMWLPQLPTWLMAAIYSILILAINAFGIKNFGRVESAMSVMKIAALVAFILYIGLILFADPNVHHPLGGGRPPWTGMNRFFPTGLGGMFQSMLIVIFAYAGIGVFASAAPEMRQTKDIDKAAWLTVVILTVLYIVSVGLLLFVVPWQVVSTTSSPFVIALQKAGAPWFAQILNATILVASFSVMAGSVFAANQILRRLGETGNAPRFVTRAASNGTSYGALILTSVGIGFTILISHWLPSNVYNFLISSSSFFSFLNWSLILCSFLSWRHRTNEPKHVSSLAFGQPVSSWLTLLFIAFLTVYALLQPDQRAGFYAFGGVVVLITATYFFVHRHKKKHPSPDTAGL